MIGLNIEPVDQDEHKQCRPIYNSDGNLDLMDVQTPRVVEMTNERDGLFCCRLQDRFFDWELAIIPIFSSKIEEYMTKNFFSDEQVKKIKKIIENLENNHRNVRLDIHQVVCKQTVSAMEQIRKLRWMGMLKVGAFPKMPMEYYFCVYEPHTRTIQTRLESYIAFVRDQMSHLKGVCEELVDNVIEGVLKETNGFNKRLVDYQNQFFTFSLQMYVIHDYYRRYDELQSLLKKRERNKVWRVFASKSKKMADELEFRELEDLDMVMKAWPIYFPQKRTN